jgi:RNA polymerase sigma-70 factor (ECF subfamily)
MNGRSHDPIAEPADLLARVARREPGAVRHCVATFGPLVWSLALRSSPTREDAEDAVQEVFVDLWRSAGRFDGNRSSPHGFVAMITRRRLIDRRRTRDRRPVLVALPEGLEPADDSHERLERRIAAQQAARALEGLKPEQRRFIELSLMQGMSHSEIARETGTPLGTVKTAIRRGLARVRAEAAGPETVNRDEVEGG